MHLQYGFCFCNTCLQMPLLKIMEVIKNVWNFCPNKILILISLFSVIWSHTTWSLELFHCMLWICMMHARRSNVSTCVQHWQTLCLWCAAAEEKWKISWFYWRSGASGCMDQPLQVTGKVEQCLELIHAPPVKLCPDQIRIDQDLR